VRLRLASAAVLSVALSVPLRRRGAARSDRLDGLVRRRLRARACGRSPRPPRPRRRVVPLVPRHGGDDLQGSRGRLAHPDALRARARGPGRAARPVEPLRGLRLAGHRRLRFQGPGAGQVPGLHRARAHARAAARGDRGPDARTLRRERRRPVPG
jgi:hypothetical protein